MTRIHPSAIVAGTVKLGSGVEIGPFAVIQEGVELGPDCQIGAQAVIMSGTTLGRGNTISPGAVLGAPPQHLHAGPEVGRLRIGDNNTFREFVTVHRAVHPDSETVLGNRNLIMVGSHIAHDCQLDDDIIVANNVMLAGHVTVGRRCYLSGAVGVHQFCRLGAHAMVGGQAHVTQDVPPCVTVDGQSGQVVGLNLIGLRRHGVPPDEMRRLKRVYRLFYQTDRLRSEALGDLQAVSTGESWDGLAREFVEFVSCSRRGVVAERHTRRRGQLRVVAPCSSGESEGEQRLVFRREVA